MVRVLIGGFRPTYPSSKGLSFLNYWCTALSNFRGFDLFFMRPLASVAWVALRPSLDIYSIIWIIEDSGLEEYFDTMVVTPGLISQGVIILSPKDGSRLMELYRPQVMSLGSINCVAPSRDSFNAWVSIVERLVSNVGTEKLMKNAVNALGWGTKGMEGKARNKQYKYNAYLNSSHSSS